MNIENLSKEELIKLRDQINNKLNERIIVSVDIKWLMDQGYLIDYETIQDTLDTIDTKYKEVYKNKVRDDLREFIDDEGLESFDWLSEQMGGTELDEIANYTDSLHGDLLIEEVGCEGISDGVREIISMLDNFETDGSSFTSDEIKTFRRYYQQMLDIIE